MLEIPDKFIVGLDYDGLGRNLPEVYKLKNNYNTSTDTMINIVLFGKPGKRYSSRNF
jgi:adenylate kinase